jgi:hypothetical protein
MMRMNQMNQLVGDNIVNASRGRTNEIRIERNPPTTGGNLGRLFTRHRPGLPRRLVKKVRLVAEIRDAEATFQYLLGV